MKYITQISRFLVGVLFIFSGLIKLNDPIGFSYKLDEYFAPDVLNMTWMQPWALHFAVFMVILETMLGVALLMGYWKKLTSWLLLLMILFFTFLTFYSAYFHKVTDCGCFGDAIKMTPWESFGKDVILTVLILIIFLNQKYIHPIMPNPARSVVMALALMVCIFLSYFVLHHLPIIDFRPYAVGKSIPEGMKSAEEMGKEPPEYGTVYYLKNVETGKEKQVTGKAYVDDKWYEKKEWKMEADKTKSVLVKEGYTPPIHDFLLTMNDQDITDSLLNAPEIFILVSYDLNKTDKGAYSHVDEFAAKAQQNDVPFWGLCANLEDEVAEKRQELQINFPMGTMDGTTLKTIIRANPGVLLLKKGIIIAKWDANDLPSFEEVSKKYL